MTLRRSRRVTSLVSYSDAGANAGTCESTQPTQVSPQSDCVISGLAQTTPEYRSLGGGAVIRPTPTPMMSPSTAIAVATASISTYSIHSALTSGQLGADRLASEHKLYPCNSFLYDQRNPQDC